MVVCQYFLQGNCSFGSRCRNSHSVQQAQGKEVCPFFLKGTCKYGNRCYKDHPANAIKGPGQSGFSKENVFGRFGNYQDSNTSFGRFGDNTGNFKRDGAQSSANEDERVVNFIRTEVLNWDGSKIWPLSCFGGYPSEIGCLAGLQDYSPEELRTSAYDADKTGRSAQYINEVTSLLKERAERKRELSRINTYSLSQEVQKARQSSQSSTHFSSFGISQGSTNNMEMNFTQVNQSMFSQPQNSNQTLASMNPVGQPFGQTLNPFGSQPPTASASVRSNPFTSQGLPYNGNMAQSSTQGFGASLLPMATKQIGQTFPSSQWGSSSVPNNQIVSQNTTNEAGNPGLALSEEDIASFKAPNFTLGKIPEIAPPPEFC